MMQRRHWLLGMAALAGHPAWAGKTAGVNTNHTPPTLAVLTAWNQGSRSWAGLWTPHAPGRGIALPARAHQVLALPSAPGSHTPLALAVARRPGEYLLRFDPLRAQALLWHSMEDDRYLAGHALMSTDATTLYTTETDGATGQGLVVERDPVTLAKRREFASGGVGPHAVLLEPGSPPGAETLLVANGGILNLPETGRRKLNLGRMDSNLTRLDARTGTVLATYRLDDPFLSLRHLARTPDGTVGVALQAEHPQPQDRRNAPAVALLDGNGLRALPMAPGDAALPGALHTWDGYAGDIAYANGCFWATAPNAGLLLGWSAQGLEPVHREIPGAGALAVPNGNRGERLLVGASQNACLLASPKAIHAIHAIATTSLCYPLTSAWDNHAQFLPAG
jgi:hypothetical protein